MLAAYALNAYISNIIEANTAYIKCARALIMSNESKINKELRMLLHREMRARLSPRGVCMYAKEMAIKICEIII